MFLHYPMLFLLDQGPSVQKSGISIMLSSWKNKVSCNSATSLGTTSTCYVTFVVAVESSRKFAGMPNSRQCLE